jgi:hypothetical protein
VYGVHKLHILSPGSSVNAGTLVANYSAMIVAPTQKDQPLFSLKRRPRFQVHKKSFGTNADLIMDPDGPETKYACAGEEQP